MASKFKIFCDEPQQATLGAGKDTQASTKREPLGLRQNVLQARPQVLQEISTGTTVVASTTTSTSTIATNAISSSSSSSSSISSTPPSHVSQVTNHQEQNLDHDQENDISIASLGSDFVPSIIHEEFDSFECEEGNNTSATTELDCQANEQQFVVDEDQDFEISVDDSDIDVDYDEATLNELNEAFKKDNEAALVNCSDYMLDIVDYLKQLEANLDLRALPNYMDFHHDIDWKKRAILINWLVEVTDEYELQTETLFICINIIDRFLSKMSISTGHFQLLGVAAMFIATKYEEIYPPYLYQFVEVTDETFSGKQIIQMEQEILRTLDFRISAPTSIYFLRQIFASNKFTRKVYNLAEYLCYLSLLADVPFLEYLPSEIALAAVILAAHQLDASANISTNLQKAYDDSNRSQLRRRDDAAASNGNSTSSTTRDNSPHQHHVFNMNTPLCIESLRAMQEQVSHDTAVYTKFSSDSHDRVSCLPPLKLEELFRFH